MKVTGEGIKKHMRLAIIVTLVFYNSRTGKRHFIFQKRQYSRGRAKIHITW